jgi:hypothetical protein
MEKPELLGTRLFDPPIRSLSLLVPGVAWVGVCEVVWCYGQIERDNTVTRSDLTKLP